MSRICIICAIPQESGPILRLFPGAKRTVIADLPVWKLESDSKSIFLLLSGIGFKKAGRAALLALDLIQPDIIINAGFCGALFPGLETGDIVAAESIYHYSSTTSAIEKSCDCELLETARLSGQPLIRTGIFISTEEIVDKKLLINHLKDFPDQPVVLEMESWSILNVCTERGTRFAAIRAVSDTAEIDPAGLFRDICDNSFTISFKKISLLLLKNPFILLQLLQLAKSAKAAGRSLAEALHFSLEQMK